MSGAEVVEPAASCDGAKIDSTVTGAVVHAICVISVCRSCRSLRLVKKGRQSWVERHHESESQDFFFSFVEVSGREKVKNGREKFEWEGWQPRERDGRF